MWSLAAQSAFLKSLIYIGVVVRLVVIGRCLARRELGRYGFFCLMMVYGIFATTLGFWLNLSHYHVLWNRSVWLDAAIDSCAAIEAFWSVARHFRNMRSFGWILIAVFAGVSAGTAGIVGLVRAHGNSEWGAGLIAKQFLSVSLVLVSLLSIVFFRQFQKIPVRPNAILHLRLLGLFFGLSSLSFFFDQITRTEWRFVSGLLRYPTLSIVLLLWLFKMKMAGEKLPFGAPSLSSEEYEAEEARHKQASDQVKQAGSEALGKTFDSPKKPKRDWRFWRRQ